MSDQNPNYKPTTYAIYGEEAPLDPKFVATQGEIDSLATTIHSKIDIDPSKFTKEKLKKMALEVGQSLFNTLCGSDAKVLNQNRLNNKHLLKKLEDPDRDAERMPYRCWRSNFDRLEEALCAKKYAFLQLNGGQVRLNDALWLRKIVRQCYRPYAVVKLIKGCEIKSEKGTQTETLPEIGEFTLEVNKDWSKVIELAKERHKIKAIYKALQHMAQEKKEQKEMEPRDVRFQVKHEVLEIEKERERELEKKKMEQRENVVKSFQHQIERTKSRRDFIDTGLTNIGKQVGEISQALNGHNGKEQTTDGVIITQDTRNPEKIRIEGTAEAIKWQFLQENRDKLTSEGIEELEALRHKMLGE